jgi:tetratricopeptide (TPR) repeat protein
MIMNPSTLQTISQIGVVVGIILTGLGGFGAYYYGKVLDEQKDKAGSTKEQQLRADISKLLTGNELLQGRLEPFEKLAKQLHPSLDQEDALGKLHEELAHLDQRTGALQQQINQAEAIAPQLDPGGRILASPFVSYASEFSEGIARARALCQEGKLDEAYSIAEGLATKRPDFGLAYFIMGTIEIQRQHLNVAEEQLNAAIMKGLLKSDEAWALNNLATIYLVTNRREEALRSLEKAVLLDPGIAEITKFRDAVKARR